MAVEIFNRQELKFVISRDQYERIRALIDPYMRLDTHNHNGRPYTLYNLYIDTHDHALIRHSLSAPVYKEKLRLRSYDGFATDKPVFLEIKKRYKRITNKRRTRLAYGDALSFVKSGRFTGDRRGTNPQVMREFETILSGTRYYPKTFITYDRVALHSRDRTADLRVTFDTALTARRYGQDVAVPLLADDQVVMEVKSMCGMPLWLASLLSGMGIYKQGFSKYGVEYSGYLKSAGAARA